MKTARDLGIPIYETDNTPDEKWMDCVDLKLAMGPVVFKMFCEFVGDEDSNLPIYYETEVNDFLKNFDII
jgi:hypothetical protein